MNLADVSIVALVAALFALVALFVVFRGFRLPPAFYENEKKRAVLRKRLLEQKMTVNNESAVTSDADEGKSNKKA